MMRKLVFIVLSLQLFAMQISAQDVQFARSIIDTLASPSMDGRGYVNSGDRKAATFLRNLLVNNGLQSFNGGFLQEYTFPMNTLPGKLEVAISGQTLRPAYDFMVWAATPSVSGTYPIVVLSEKDFVNTHRLARKTKNVQNKFILVDRSAIKEKSVIKLLDSLRNDNFPGAKGIIMVVDRKLGWSVMAGSTPRGWPVIEVAKKSLPVKSRIISLDLETSFEPEHKACNVLAYVQGAVQPDTFLVFTAHYDHLGRMGKEVYFPGANDNASGTAMVCDLARYYSTEGNEPYYSMAFFLLSGEEAGLFGAKYCAAHLPMNDQKIKFLVNLDMVGTGSEGVTMVNGTIFEKAFKTMEKINADNEYVLMVKQRGESCNSDHCPFFQKGIPSVFIYSMGKEFGEYHNPDDKSDKIPLSEYKDIFRLMVDFMKTFKPN